MLRHRLWLLPAVLAWGAPLAGQSLAGADSLLAAGDTSGAILALERLLKKDHRNAEAHYRVGRLYMSRHVPGRELSPDRRKADEHFRYATRFESDSAKYWLALADLFRGENMGTVRVQVQGLLDRANRAALAARDPLMADVSYRQARAAWNSFGSFGRRYRTVGTASLAPPSRDEGWKAITQYYREQVVPLPDAGTQYLDEAEERLRTALGINPVHLDAAGLLVVVFGERDRWEEAAAITRRLIRAVPDSGRAWALHGLAMARVNRWPESAAAFAAAFRRLGPADLAPFRNLGQIMRRADELRFGQIPEPERPTFDSLYWRVAQPLALTENNEVQAEFYARIVYAQLRWSDPWRGHGGIETDMGSVFVRYGPPDLATSTSWLYEKPRFLFHFYMNPGFARAFFAGESEWQFGQAQSESPARFDNIPIMRTLDTVLVQAARFRGPGDSLAVLVMGAIPLRRLTDSVAVADLPLVTGALVADPRGREITRDRQAGTVTGTQADELQYRTFRLQLAPGDYLLRVEAHLPSLDRGARAMQPLPAPAIARRGLALSDLLVARRVVPRDSAARRWDDFLIEPNAGRFEPGDPVGLLWEVYQLTADSSGATRYEVSLLITVEAIDRSGAGWFATLLGDLGDRMGVTAVHDDKVSLTYRRKHPGPAQAEQVEHLLVELRDAPRGRYGLEVVVTDLVSGQSAAAVRTFTIGTDPVTRGPASNRF